MQGPASDPDLFGWFSEARSRWSMSIWVWPETSQPARAQLTQF